MKIKKKSGFPLGGRSRMWLALLAAVECSMSSLVKPPREKPLLLLTAHHSPFTIRYLLFEKEVVWFHLKF
ncbi:MAG: hypothetical protein DRI36_01525 [Caldiserica bacterium]|nr:MAG: hypothetical protein DRI36_01525 [Caldisericota bacterium]